MKEEHVDLVKHQISQIDDLLDLHDQDMKFQKWCQKTSMILEEIIGAKDPKIDKFKHINYMEMRTRTAWEPRPSPGDIVAYKKGLEKARLLLEDIVERYELFEKSKQHAKMDDETIRKRIMEAAYSEYKESGFRGGVNMQNMIERLGISLVDYDRNEEYLQKKYLIKYPYSGHFSITEDGIDLMESLDPSEQERIPGIHLTDIHAPVSIVIGNLNTSISNIEQKGISDLPAILKELTQIIESSKLNDDDKVEAIENLETMAGQANKTKPNKNVVKAALDTILDKAGKISGAIELLKQVGAWFKIALM